jgi:hypothetical protein
MVILQWVIASEDVFSTMAIPFSLRRLFDFFLASIFLLAVIQRSVASFERPGDRFFTPYAST